MNHPYKGVINLAEETNGNSGTQGQPEGGSRLFSQEEVNDIISKRVNELNETKQKAIDDAVAKALKKQADKQRIEALEGEEKLKAEYQARLDEIEAERKAQQEQLLTAQRALSISKAEAQLASLNLPPEFAVNLLGKDDKETTKLIQDFNSKINELVASKVNDSLARGTPRINTNGDGQAKTGWQAEIDRAFAKKY